MAQKLIWITILRNLSADRALALLLLLHWIKLVGNVVPRI